METICVLPGCQSQPHPAGTVWTQGWRGTRCSFCRTSRCRRESSEPPLPTHTSDTGSADCKCQLKNIKDNQGTPAVVSYNVGQSFEASAVTLLVNECSRIIFEFLIRHQSDALVWPSLFQLVREREGCSGFTSEVGAFKCPLKCHPRIGEVDRAAQCNGGSSTVRALAPRDCDHWFWKQIDTLKGNFKKKLLAVVSSDK